MIPKKFDDSYKRAIEDALSHINYLSPNICSNHSHFDKISFKSCCFGIDVVSPPFTPVVKFSGDSAGVAIFLAVLSAFFEIPVPKDIAVTGCFRSNLASDIGLVGEMTGKIESMLSCTHTGINRFIVPNIRSLLKEEVLNEEELRDLYDAFEALCREKAGDRYVIQCRSILETLKYIFDPQDFRRLLETDFIQTICTFQELFDDLFDPEKTISLSSGPLLQDIYSHMEKTMILSHYYLERKIVAPDLSYLESIPKLKVKFEDLHMLLQKGVHGDELIDAFEKRFRKRADKIAKRLQKVAQDHEEKGKPKEAIQCRKEAQKWKSGDKESVSYSRLKVASPPADSGDETAGRKMSAGREQLENYLGRYVGRKEEVNVFESILEKIDSSKRREHILSLYGFGGIGKTSLLEIFRDIAQKNNIRIEPRLPRDEIVVQSISAWLSDVFLFDYKKKKRGDRTTGEIFLIFSSLERWY